MANTANNLKPLVLLDVDGVINDLGALYGLPRPHTINVVASNGYRVEIPDYMPGLIQHLVATCEVWWCTTWRNAANREIADHLGIPHLPVIDDGTDVRAVSWKPAAAAPVAAATLAEGRTVLWIEDFYGTPPVGAMPPGVIFVDTATTPDGGVLRTEHLPAWLRPSDTKEVAA